jgi:hypothetical protein
MATNRSNDAEVTRDRNEDPITGQPGAHPVAAGVGAALGGAAGIAGAAAAGAAAGTAAGPVGTVVGAVIGGVAGGLAGKAAGEAIDPTEEEAYWRDAYTSRDYVRQGDSFDTYRPAYRYGLEHAQRLEGRSFTEVENDLRKSWTGDGLDWERAKPAVRDAYDRVCTRMGRGRAGTA